MKKKLTAFYKGITKKRNLGLLNSGAIILICIYFARTYFVKKEILETVQRIEVKKVKYHGYLEGLNDGVDAKRSHRIESKLEEYFNLRVVE